MVIVNPGQSIQNAIDSLPPTGGIIQLLSGNYSLTSTIIINNRQNIEIYGNGMYNTTLNFAGNFIQVNNSTNITLRDFGCVGGNGINFYDYSSNSLIKNIYLSSNGDWNFRNGIGIGNGNTNFSNNITVQGCILYAKNIGAYDYATDVIFDGNTVDSFMGSQYAAIDANRAKNITFKNNTITNTLDPQYSIGVYATSGSIVSNNIVKNSRGIWCYDSAPTILNNNIESSYYYGIIVNADYPVSDGLSTPIIKNNIIYNGYGDGIHLTKSVNNNKPINATIESNTIYNNNGEGISNLNLQTGIVKNNIIVNNKRYGISGSGLTLSYNDIWNNTLGNYNGVLSGTGDISSDPLFANLTVGDFHLKSQGSRWTGTTWISDSITSPCINAGDQSTIIINCPVWGCPTRIEIGAYGNTTEASSYQVVTCPTPICSINIIQT